jgi:hypothetical protein
MRHRSLFLLAALVAPVAACSAHIDGADDRSGDTWSAGDAPGSGSPECSEPPDSPDVLPDGSLPIVPGGRGFGISTPAGSGRHLDPPKTTVYKVTTLADSGPGSLRACVEQYVPRVCVFEVSGVIELRRDLEVRDRPYLTIAGQTAPSPGIMIRGWSLLIYNTHDVLVQHLRIRVGDDPVGPDVGNRDNMWIGALDGMNTYNVVIDHCSFSWATDETVSVWDHWDDITFNHNLFAEALNGLLHQEAGEPEPSRHPMGPIAGGYNAGSISFIGNLFANQESRNPLIFGPRSVIANNVIYNSIAGIQIAIHPNYIVGDTASTIVGNVFRWGPDYYGWPWGLNVDRTTEVGPKIFLHDFDADINPNDDGDWPGVKALIWDGNDSASRAPRSLIEVSVPPVTLPGFIARSTAGGAVWNRVLADAGARPADRDQVDARIVEGVRTKTGRMVNCVAANGTEDCESNAGGWPSYARNTRSLELPSDYNQVAPSGYTRLEEWLHDHARAVEAPRSASHHAGQ